MKTFVRHVLGPLLAVALLAGLAYTDAARLRPADAGDYHQRVAAAVDAVPYVVGDWIAHDVPIPTRATEMLKPNALLSRQYLNTRTGQRVSVLLVHTLDARDLIGHYPPECYPAAGWTLDDRYAVDFTTPDGAPRPQQAPPTVEVARYRFHMNDFTRRRHLDVINLMILPTGEFSIGMAGLSGVSGDYRVRHFGAAALQFVFPEQTPRDQAEAVWQALFPALRPALNTIASATPANPE